MYLHFLPLYELECEILVTIPASMLDSTLALRGKDDNIVRKNMNCDLVKIKQKHAKGRTFLSREIKNTTKYLQSLSTFSTRSLLSVFSKL